MKLLIYAIFLSAFCAAARAADRPNILLVLVDDMGCGDVRIEKPPQVR